LRIALYTEIPADPAFRAQWNLIAMEMERPEVFYTCEWALSIQSAYAVSLKPLLLAGYEGDQLVGIASLATDVTGRAVSFLAATTADYCDFLSAPGLRENFIAAVLTKLQEGNFLSLTLANLPADSPTTQALRNHAKNHGFHHFIRPAYLCAQVELGTVDQREQLKASLTGKKKLRRYLREMERTGPVNFAHLKSREEIEAALPEFSDAHVARFQALGRTSSLATPERRAFLAELTRAFNGSGVVTLSLLKIQDQPAAWNFGFQFHKSWFWYQPTFDSRQEINSPGHCLLARIVVEACDMKEIDVVDLGLGAEGYKERFGNSTRQTVHVTLNTSQVRHWSTVARFNAAEALKRSPKVESRLRRFLGRQP
jgi:CelD/BcsL family acetyltransferase involved in cellulose biosynthesis